MALLSKGVNTNLKYWPPKLLLRGVLKKKIMCSGVFGPTKTIWVQNIDFALLHWALMGDFSLKGEFNFIEG